MSEEVPTVGTILRSTREAQGLSIQDAANRLRLMNRQVVAMETDDFASLGQPVFVRGFIRNYARLLGLDAKAMLEIVGGEVQPIEVAKSSPVVLPGAWFTSGWLITGLLALLALVVLPIGLYAWLGSDAVEIPPAAARTPVQVAPHISPTVTPVSPPAIEPSASRPDNSLTESPASLPSDPSTSGTPPPAVSSEMNFEFGDNAWVDVRDGTGQILHRHMNSKGSTLVLSGQPPFTLVLGNAAQIRMTYKGRPVELAPYIDGNVARLSLEE